MISFSSEYDGGEKGPQATEIDENTGFAMVVNGHSLVHCLTPQLEEK